MCIRDSFQAFILACGVFPIYKFAEKKLSSKTTALLIAGAYLFYPALHGANLFDIHGLTFSTTFLLFTFYYLDQGKLTKTIIFAVLSICCREDVALVIFMLGIYSIIKIKTCVARKSGIIVIILSCLWIIAFFSRGYFLGNPELMQQTSVATNWDQFGGTFLSSPLQFLQLNFKVFFTGENIKYIFKLIMPVLGLCCLSPTILLIAVPNLLLNLMSNWHQMHQIEYHYTATITPFMFLAAINGIMRLKQWAQRFSKLKTDRIPVIIGSLILTASIISTTQFSILRFHKTWHVSENHKKLAKKLHEIPAELSVSTTARPGAHLANRKELYHFPEHFSKTGIIVIELNRPEVEIKNIVGKLRTMRVPAMNEFAQSVFQDTTVGLRFVEDNVFCLQRGIDTRASFKTYFFCDEIPSEMIKAKKIEVGNRLYFLGWKPVYIGDRQAHFQIFWLTEKQQTGDVQLKFYLRSGDSIIEIPHKPLFGKIPIHEWAAGEIIVDHLFINRPQDEEVTMFSVEVSVSDVENTREYHLFEFNFP